MIYYAIINCKDTKLDFDYTNDLVEKGINKKDIKEYIYDGTTTLAHVKNLAIQYARKKKYTYIFLIENDLIIKDVEIFQKYIDLMLEYKLGVIYYGYYGNINRVLDNLPNPSVKVKLKDKEQMLVRIPTDAFIGIDLTLNSQLFDETFEIMEFNEYLKRCHTYKILPFQGFYFDVNNSYEYFEYVDGQPTPKRNISREKLEQDKKYVDSNKGQLTLVYDSNAPKILDYIKEIKV